MFIRKIICCSVLLLASFGASAQSSQALPDNLYLSAFIDRQSLGEDDNTAELKPVAATASVGYWVRRGIGLELEASIGLAGDSVGSLDVDFKSALGANLRLESPPRGGFAAYALFGYVRSAFDATINGFNSSITLPGGRVALGLTYALSQQLQFDVAFSHHDYDSDTRTNSFRFGLRYNFGS